jgi:hypothetical protein
MQITKLSFLSTQAVGDNVFAIEEFLDIPIDQVFGTHRAREKALFNFIDSDAVEKVSRDTWKIVKDITLDAANVKMRQGDFFRVRLDEEGDDSPIHFGLDATGVFVLSRAVFASLQTYRVLEPGVQESVRMQFTFGGQPVIDAKLTSKFSSMSLVPVDATAGIYELKVFTAMAPSDDIISIEVTGTSLGNNVYEAPVRLTVREPVLTIVPIDVQMAQKQTKGVTWQLLMEGVPAPAAIPVQAQPDELIRKVLSFTLLDATQAIYEMRATAGDTPGTSPVVSTYDFGRGYIATKEVDVNIEVAPAVFITQDTQILEANQTQLIRFYAKWVDGNLPVTNAQFSTTDIRGPGIESVEPTLIALDPAAGLYAYRVTTNHKGGPVSVRTNITSNGIPYPVFFDLTSKSTPVTAIALNTLPAAATEWLTFRVQQERLGGLTPLVGVVAKQFTVTGVPVVGVQGAVEAVGQGVYRLKVVTNDRGGQVNVSAVLTVDDEDHAVSFTTTAAALSQAMVVSTGPALTGEQTQAVPVEVRFEGQLYDLGTPSVIVTGNSLISYGALRRTGVGKYEIQSVNVNGKGGILSISVTGKVQGFNQTLGTTVAVNPVSAVVASNITHYRPTTQGPLKFTALRDGVALALTFSKATLTGAVTDFDGTIETINANTGEYQVKNAVASAPSVQSPIGISAPYKLKGYSYTLVFNSYTEAMPTLTVDTQDVIPAGDVKTDYRLYFAVDGVIANLQDSNVSGSGTSFVSMDSPKLMQISDGIWAVQGLLPGPDRGQIVISGTVLIDGITYHINVPIRTKDTKPDIDNPDIPPGTDPSEIPGSGDDGEPGPNDDLPYLGPIEGLEPELYQTVYFKLAKKGNPIGDATLANGIVTGRAIESYDGFALHDAATGTYRFNVMTNGLGGYVEINVDITIDGDVYPTTYRSFAKKAKAWAVVSSSSLASATSGQEILFSITNDGKTIGSPYLRALDVTGSVVRAASKNLEGLGNSPYYTYRTGGIRIGSPAGDVKLSIQGSTNNINWHDMEKIWALPEASKPIVTVGPMIPAVATSTLTFRIQRNSLPLFAPTFANLSVSGEPVDVATLDWVKLNANGTYGTTVKTNDKGGDINVSFDVIDDGVTYHYDLIAQADIVRPWTAVLKTTSLKPEIATNIDFQSMYGGAPVAMTNPKVTVVGDCLVSPTAEITPIYQDGVNQIYRVPNVLVNNDGGPITLEISGTVYDQQVSTVLQMTVTPLPDMQIVGVTTELPFRQTSDWTFKVNRGEDNPSVFASNAVSNLSVTGAAVAGYTPTVVPVSNGVYKVSVQTNSLGGTVSMAFDVTIAGQTHHLTLDVAAAVEPPVTARSINTLETNAVATNLDFQLMRGTVPCADSFLVKSVSITGRSVTSYPQSVINVDVANGKYRMQVNTSAYSDVAHVTINATVRGEDTVLTFDVQIAQGVLPTVSMASDSFIYNLMSSGVLAFKQGETAITGVTVTAVEGPLDQWTVSGTTLNGIPTQKGQSTLNITFSWKGASYTGSVDIMPANSIFVTPIGDPKLKAYVANKVNFPLVQENGSAYPGTTTFSVATGPFTATTLTQEADGTYSMNLTYAGELLPTNIIVTATNGSEITKHIIAYSVWFNLEARFTGTALLDSTQVSNQVQFDVWEINQNNVKSVYSGVQLNSLDVNAPNEDDLIGFSTFSIMSATQYRGTFLVSTQPVDLSDMTFQFFWTSPLRTYTIKGKFRVQKPIVATWIPKDLEGGRQDTVQFYLKSGSMPITDAVDATSTVTNATIKKAPYVVDSATGLYAIDVQPSGNATTMTVTLKVKQAINNLTSTLTAKSLPVTPGAYAAVPTLTLKRQIESQNLDMQFTQGGIPLSGVTVNSVTFDGAIQSMGAVTVVSSTTYRWPTVVSLDGATPHIIFNITVGGVGMVLEVDYPIADPVKPDLVFSGTPTFTRGRVTTPLFKLRLGSTVYSVTSAANTPYNFSGFKITDGADNFTANGLVSETDGGGRITGWLKMNFFSLKAGTQILKLDVSMNGVIYHTETTIDVVDGAIVEWIGTYDLRAKAETTMNFRISPPAGVTLDPTVVPTWTTQPYPITQATVANGDGTYTMKVKPTAESIGGNGVGTIVSGGVTYNFGSPPLQVLWNLAFGVNNTAVFPVEVASATIYSYNQRAVDALDGSALTWRLDGYGGNISNIRATADVDVINGTPGSVVNNTYSTRFNVPTKKVDFANILFTFDVTSVTTGYVYKDLTVKAIAFDTVIWTYIPPTDGYLSGQKYDIQFKLTYQTSGKPVTNAVYKQAHGAVGCTTDAVFKVIDAANGIYAVPTTIAQGGTTFSVTPRAGFVVDAAQNLLSYTTLAGAQQTMSASSALTSILPILSAYASGTVTTLRPQYLGFKSSPQAGLSGQTVTNMTTTSYAPAQTLNGTELDPNLWFVAVNAGANPTAPQDGWTVTYPMTPNITFSKDGVDSVFQLNATVFSNVVPVTAMTEITTLGGEVHLTVQAGVTSSFTAMGSMPCDGWTLYGIDGEVINGLGGAVSTYATDTKVHLNLPELPAIRHGVLVVRTMNSTNNFKIHVGATDVNVVKLNKAPISSGGVMTIGAATTVTFSLTPPDGVTYSNPTVTVENNPWTTSGTLVDNGDGTYSITITPDVETGGRIIKLKVVNAGQTYYHGVKTVAKDSVPYGVGIASVAGETLGNLNGPVLYITKNGVEQMWNLSGNEATLPHSSVQLSTTATGVTINPTQYQNNTLLQRLGIFATSSAPAGSADYADIKTEFDVISPVTGLTSHLSYIQGVAKAYSITWDTTVIPVWGVETVIPFTMKYTSSSGPVTNLGLVSASITSGTATVKQELVTIDAATGKYGVKVTTGSTANCTLSITVRVGNRVNTDTYSRLFASTAGATVTMAAMAGATRTIGIKLAGATAGDVITATGEGAIMDATSGSWTPTASGVIFVPLPASNRTRPTNTNTTPSTVDTFTITYTRGGQTYTVPCSITVFWLNAKVTGFTITSDLLQFSGNVAGAASTWTFNQCTFLNETGTSIGTNGTSPTNNIATDGKVYWNLNARLAAQPNVSFTGSGSFSGSTFYYWSDPFTIARVPYPVMTPAAWNFTMAQADAGKVIDLADMALTFTDDLGAPLTGVSFNTVPGVDNTSGFRGIFQPRLADGTDWSKALVPLTDGSDGKYVLKLSSTGKGFSNYWVNVFSSTFVFNTSIGLQTMTISARIN